jgi:lipoprotein-anchoring transpeptidase ErfK/SrfK
MTAAAAFQSMVYRAATHGCIRLHPDDVAWLLPGALVP